MNSRTRRLVGRALFWCCFAAIAGSIIGCSDDNPASTPTTGDYFPFSRNYVWNYRSNIFASKGMPDTTFQMKIDTASYYNGTVGGLNWWYFIGKPTVTQA